MFMRKLNIQFKQSLFITMLLLLSLGACKSKKFSAPMKLGGTWVPARTLNQGYDIYMNNCMSCHGVLGDGKGPAAQGQMPLPRDFTSGLFKFANVQAGSLPRDEDLKHTIRYGLRGTGMLPWDLSDKDLHAVTQYIKTFSDEWQKGVPGEVVAKSEDPWGLAKASEAIAQGEKIYHGLAQCWSCHPSYVPMDKISEYSQELVGSPVSSIRRKPYLSTLLDSSYDTKVMPPDLTNNFIKTGSSLESIYTILGVGINGTAMPAWKGLLSPAGDEEESEKNQWALAYYVKHLYEMKFNHVVRRQFMENLNERRAQHDRYDDIVNPQE
jgi:mono/diheme cytochrome c family protein